MVFFLKPYFIIFVAILEMIKNAFVAYRFLSIFFLVLPLWGLLERLGLYKKMEAEFQYVKDATAGRILQLYMTVRQASVTLGIMLGEHQIARTLVAPMVLEAAKREGRLLPSMVDRVKAMIVATENCGNFFGQLLFIASGGSLFVRAVLEQAGYPVSILRLVLYALPTALAAYVIVMVRMKNGAEGIKVQVLGCLNGAEIARSEMYKEERTPLHTFRAVDRKSVV